MDNSDTGSESSEAIADAGENDIIASVANDPSTLDDIKQMAVGALRDCIKRKLDDVPDSKLQ